MSLFLKLIGVAGLLLIIRAIFIHKRKKHDLFSIAGGILLTVYSISLADVLFIILQVTFTLAVTYDYFKGGRN